MPKVVFVKEKQELEVAAGSNLRQEARKAGIVLYPGMANYFNCRGLGTCGTCRVLVKNGMENLSPRTFKERLTFWRMLSAIGQEDELRLACQCTVNGDCSVETQPAMNWSGETFWQKPYPNK